MSLAAVQETRRGRAELARRDLGDGRGASSTSRLNRRPGSDQFRCGGKATVLSPSSTALNRLENGP